MEVFKKIKGYENYEVSNYGNVKSIDHFVRSKNNSKRVQKGRLLTKPKTVKGYLQVSLSNNGIRFNTGVHRLVALAFIPNPENKPQVNHINGIKDDNSLENLEWCTNKENQIHAVKNNLCNPNLGEKHHNSKLTNEQVKNARRMFKLGMDNITLSRLYNISAPAMSKILRNKTYINIK